MENHSLCKTWQNTEFFCSVFPAYEVNTGIYGQLPENLCIQLENRKF